jgi:hypothetical protein
MHRKPIRLVTSFANFVLMIMRPDRFPYSIPRLAMVAALVLGMSGCAVSQNDFYNNPHGASNLEICRALRNDEARYNPHYTTDLLNELAARQFNPAGCQQIINQNNAEAGLAIGALAVAAAVAANKHDKNNGSDDWRWDTEYRHHGSYTVCRNTKTGRVGDDSYCQ